MIKIRILHIWDIVDNSRLISQKLNEMGHKSIVVDRKRMTIGLFRFILNVIIRLLTFRADIIHINAWTKGVFFARILSPKSKIIMHFHGSEIRGKSLPSSVLLLADIMGYSTRDIFDQVDCEGYHILLPVIVDDMFYDRGGRVEKTALYVHHYQDYLKKALSYTILNGLGFNMLNRMANPPIVVPRTYMPVLLSKMEYYLDFKGYTNIHTLTLTAKEAIACGCKVVVDNYDIVTEFEETTIKDYVKVYNNLTTWKR